MSRSRLPCGLAVVKEVSRSRLPCGLAVVRWCSPQQVSPLRPPGVQPGGAASPERGPGDGGRVRLHGLQRGDPPHGDPE